jgi:hypothetical protein
MADALRLTTHHAPRRRPYQARTVHYAGACWRVANHGTGRLITTVAVQGTRPCTPGVRADCWAAA